MRSSIVLTIALITSVSALATNYFDRRDVGGLCSAIGSACDTDASECCDEVLGVAFCNDDGVIDFESCDASCTQIGSDASCDG
jgi:hypothetical protein